MKLQKIRLLDAFAGIGGFHLGVQQACEELGIDFECVGAIEFDKNARQTYKDNFPNVEMFDKYGGDITKIPVGEIPDHDILTGGFPCQPFSMAGKAYKNNKTVVETDERHNLFTYLIKILEEKKPPMFIFENVAGILNLVDGSGSLVIDIICKKISQAGYKVCIQQISPHQIGVPQKRERIFFIGTLKDNKSLYVNIKQPQTKTILKDILETQVDPKYLLKNINIWNQHGQIRKIPRIDMLKESLQLRKSKHKVNSENTVLAAEINGDTPSGRSRQTNRAYHHNGLSPTLTTVDKRIVYDTNGEFRYLTEIEYARLQGFPDNFKISKSSNSAYHQFGNAVCVKVVKFICGEILNVD